jgi:prepilin-type processing-associated H-X9-DG protein
MGGCEDRHRLGIGYNWSYSPGYGGDRGWLSDQKLDSLERPAEFVTFTDSNCMGTGNYNTNTFLNWQQYLEWPAPNPLRHNEGLNVGYADGHSKWSKIMNLKENQFHPVAGMPNP